MQTCSTPLTEFHAAIRAVLDDEDHEVHSACKITEKIKVVVVINTGHLPRYKITADGSSVVPGPTPDTDQKGHLCVKETGTCEPRSSRLLIPASRLFKDVDSRPNSTPPSNARRANVFVVSCAAPNGPIAAIRLRLAPGVWISN